MLNLLALLQGLSDPIHLDRVDFLYLHGRFNRLRELMGAEPRMSMDRQEVKAWIDELVSSGLLLDDARFQTECW